jgi:hypothetical protein
VSEVAEARKKIPLEEPDRWIKLSERCTPLFTTTSEYSTKYHDLPGSASFWSFLLAVDDDLAAEGVMDGFFDCDNVPPWDTWVGCIYESERCSFRRDAGECPRHHPAPTQAGDHGLNFCEFSRRFRSFCTHHARRFRND